MADMGYNAFIGNRIDYQLLYAWRDAQQLEFIWRPSESRGKQGELFAHIFDSHYCIPTMPDGTGFEWEYGFGQMGTANSIGLNEDTPPKYSPFLVANTSSPISKPNVAERAAMYATEMKRRAKWFRTRNLLVPHGCDFHFQNAAKQYTNLDLLISEINLHPEVYGITLRYATISDYIEAVHRTNTTWPVFGGDFHPYRSGIVIGQ
jgi:hypothetical protein